MDFKTIEEKLGVAFQNKALLKQAFTHRSYINENRGLNPHIEDITRRLALENYIAFAPDALTPLGGYPGEEEAAVKLFGTLDGPKRTEDLVAGANFVKTHAESNGRLGAVGFCFGGGICNLFATRMPDLLASVPYYGAQAPAADVPKIKAPLQIHYAGLDERINAGWPAYEAALKANNKYYEAYIYPNVNHGFNNDTTPRYDEAAAKLSWQRTLEFFAKHVRG
jgi:carboxymethylenebutenolidase